MSLEIRYPALLKAQAHGFIVEFIDLEDTFTEGHSEAEALFNASEVLTVMLDWRLDNDQLIPTPSPAVAGARYIAPSARTQAALLMRQARGERSPAELAHALGASWSAVQRLEDAHHWPTLKQLEKAAAVLGKRLVLSLE